MSKMQLIVKHTTAFKKDFKIAEKRGLKMELLENVISMLAMGKTFPPDNKIMNYPENGRDTASVIFKQIGF